MSLSPQFLDEIRSRTLLSGLIGKSVKLQKAGREWKACCPFHNEKTPSFYVNDEKGFYHCFGCQAHGDAFSWLVDARGLAFVDAVKELADQAGIAMPAPDPKARERAERAVGLYEVMEAAAGWFSDQLKGVEGSEARDYLETRGIARETLARFGFGYAPDSRGKLRAALNRFGTEMLVEAGLLIAPDDGKDPYDRFRRRLMFPVRDARGRCIAFSGRILGPGEPKYINSPDTPLFDKGRTLFNIDKAGPASRANRRVIIVEGQMDVVALDQAGFPETVAPMGTALTEAQIEHLWRLSNKPLLCFDGDTAGQKAAVRAARRALPMIQSGHTLGFIPMPEGRDPDDLIRMAGPAAFTSLLSKPRDLLTTIWLGELAESETATPEGRAGLKERLAERVASIQNPHIRGEYKKILGDLFWEKFGWGKKRIQEVSADIAESRKTKRKGFEYLLVRAILLGMCRYPDVLRDNHDLADALEIDDPYQRRWYEKLSLWVLESPNLNEDMVEEMLGSSDVAPIEKRNLHKDLAFSFFRKREPERGRQDLREVLGTIVAEREVERALASASARFGQQLEAPEWEEQQRLISERRAIRVRLERLFEQATGWSPDEEAIASKGRPAGMSGM